MSKPKIDRDINAPLELIKELLTDSEWRMIKQRILIIELLGEGHSIRQIAGIAKVGTDTVVRVARKVEANPKIREFFRAGKPGLSSKWVFGETNFK